MDTKSVQRTTQSYHSPIRLEARLSLPRVQTCYLGSSNGLKGIYATGLTCLPCLGTILAAFLDDVLARRKSARVWETYSGIRSVTATLDTVRLACR